MQTPPVKLLPVDPAQKSAPRDLVDRGFKDLLEQKPETPDPIRTSVPQETRETAQDSDARPRPAKGVAGTKSPTRKHDGDDAGDAGNPAPEIQSVAAPASEEQASVIAGNPDADIADASAAGMTVTTETLLPPVTTADAGESVQVPATAETGAQTIAGTQSDNATGDADAGTVATGTTVKMDPALLVGQPVEAANVTFEPVGTSTPTKPNLPETTSVDTPPTDKPITASGAAAAPTTAHTAGADGPPATTAVVQPVPTAEQQTSAANPAQVVVAEAAPRLRNGTSASGSLPANGPAAAGQPDDAPPLTPLNSKADDARPAASAAPTGQAQSAANGQPAAAAGASAPQASDSTAQAQAATPLDTLAAAGNPAQPAGDPPAHHTATGPSHHTAPAATFAHELRSASDAAATSDAAAARNAPTPPPAANQLAFQISRAALNGQDQFTVSLKPAALGKITIKLELGHDHRVMAVISADRADTLDLLQRDARTLERALQDAGLKADSGSLSFNLQGEGTGNSPSEDDMPYARYTAFPFSAEGDDALAAIGNPYARVVNASGIDIHV